jgi:hypothetical protein
MKITICGSMIFLEKFKDIEKELIDLGQGVL